ncbi:MAG: GNAT family N-acetyltransferase [Acidobacteria bacterium]|nr:GNAT family N-acetyltransferase [Acidobacteriota bacterium]
MSVFAQTDRLVLRELIATDAEFIHELFTGEEFLRNIGDRGIRSPADARDYIERGPRASYRERGYGFYVIELKSTGIAAGICGLILRDGLDHADVGFALLPPHCGSGYATEAAVAVLAEADRRGIDPVLAIAQPENGASLRVLEKIGMHRAGSVRLPGETIDLALYSTRPDGGA